MPLIHRLFSLVLTVLLSCSSVVRGQNNPYVFRHITTEDGLSGNDVRSIIQDSKGFIWVATNNGLQKYDGYSFTSYHHNPVDSETISSDNLLVLSKDNQDKIWTISFLAGINRFDPVLSKCIRINELNKESFEQLFLPNAICNDRQGNMWLIASKSIALFNSVSEKLAFPKNILPENYDGYFMDAQYDAGKNQLWLADAKNGVCMYDLNQHTFFNHDHNPDNVPLFNIKCNAIKILLDNAGNIWVHGYDGFLIKYNLRSNITFNYFLYESDNSIIRLMNTQKQRQLQPIFVSTMYSDLQGNIWIAAGTKGLLQYIPLLDSFRSIPSVSTFTNGLNFNTDIHCIFQDKEGNIWIGTDKGINIFSPLRQRFHFFDSDPFDPVTKTRNETMDFLQSKQGDVWVATWGNGLNVFDSGFVAKKHFTYKPDNKGTIPVPGNLVWSLAQYNADTLAIGYQAGLLSTVNTQTFQFTHYKPVNLGHVTIMNMTASKENKIWLALFSGIAQWNSQQIDAVRYNAFNPYNGVSTATASDILPDHKGHLWVGTLGLGLQKFDLTANKFTEIFTPSSSGNNSISSALINCLIPLNDSTIAIGTGSGGIDIFNSRTKRFVSINTADGLPSNNISAMYFIPPYSLWAATGTTLSKIDLSNRHISSFGSGDGIRNLDFSGCHRMYMLRDGKLLVGYKGGFLYFYPDSIKNANPPSNVSITGVKIFDQMLAVDSLLQKSDTIILSYKQNFLTLQYASLSYLEANRIIYHYRLKGIDKNWVNGNTERLVSYTNLQPGSYTFEVRCENSDGLSCAQTTRLTFIIAPPFWQTLWFRFLIITALVVSLYLLYKYRVNQILRVQHMRNEISKDLHDDVGSTLSSISILSQVAKNKMEEGEQEQSSSIMSRINNSSQEMVEKIGDIVWAVNSHNDNMQDIIVKLRNTFLETCVSRNIHLSFSCDPSLEKRITSMQIRKNIYLICKEAINNAIKYSGGTRIVVSFSIISGEMVLIVTDNGNGFDPDRSKSGNGLLNMQTRADEMKGRLKFISAENGLSVVLTMAIPKNR